MFLKFNSHSLENDFKNFSFLVVFFLILSGAILFLTINYRYQKNKEDEIFDVSKKIERDLSEKFLIIENYSKRLGKYIRSQGTITDEKIESFFSQYLYLDNDHSDIWNNFIWFTSDGSMLPKSYLKKMDSDKLNSKKTKDYIYNYLNLIKSKPNKLVFSEPFLSLRTKSWVIPSGLGILNKNNNYIGAISNLITLKELEDLIEHSIELKTYDPGAIVLDKKHNFIVSSANLNFSYSKMLPSPELLKELKNELAKIENKGGYIANKIRHKGYEFTYFKEMEDYEFIIIIAKRIWYFDYQLLGLIITRIIELLVISTTLLLILSKLRRKLVSPVLFLAEYARKSAENDFYKLKSYSSYDEINLLFRQVENLKIVKESEMHLRKSLEAVNNQMERTINERTAELEKALAFKDEVFNDISHEVRTPIQGITSISMSLAKNWHIYQDEQRIKIISSIASNSQRILSLVVNILDMSMFKNGCMNLIYKDIDFIPLIEAMIKECYDLYLTNKNINIFFNKSETRAMIKADPDKINQVLRNLLSNAIKFTKEGEIIISLQKRQILVDKNISDSFILKIKDPGCGIYKTELEKIFEIFFKSELTRYKYPGAGVGLAICKKIVEQHEGKIWVENNEKSGVSFFVSLPINFEYEENIIMQNQVVEEKVNNPKMDIKILMIDDEEICHMSVEIFLQHTEYKLISQYSGKSGLKYLNENYKDISLVLLDLKLPDIYGGDVLDLIVNNPRLSNIPVVIQSAVSYATKNEKFIESGAKAFLSKPYCESDVIKIIKKVLGLD